MSVDDIRSNRCRSKMSKILRIFLHTLMMLLENVFLPTTMYCWCLYLSRQWAALQVNVALDNVSYQSYSVVHCRWRIFRQQIHSLLRRKTVLQIHYCRYPNILLRFLIAFGSLIFLVVWDSLFQKYYNWFTLYLIYRYLLFLEQVFIDA